MAESSDTCHHAGVHLLQRTAQPPDTRTKALRNLDLSLLRDVRFSETWRAQLRLEVYDVTDTTTLGNPVSHINAANFGQVTTLRNGTAPRRIQLGVKVTS